MDVGAAATYFGKNVFLVSSSMPETYLNTTSPYRLTSAISTPPPRSVGGSTPRPPFATDAAYACFASSTVTPTARTPRPCLSTNARIALGSCAGNGAEDPASSSPAVRYDAALNTNVRSFELSTYEA